jgi:hypothetical protein
LLGLAIVAAGGALNWGWLTAVGAAPIILALAPCAVMCALGMGMMGGDKKSCATGAENPTNARGLAKAGHTPPDPADDSGQK